MSEGIEGFDFDKNKYGNDKTYQELVDEFMKLRRSDETKGMSDREVKDIVIERRGEKRRKKIKK